MKLIARIFTATAMAAALGACNGASDTLVPDYIAVKVDKADDWGFLAPDGEVILADEFKDEPSAVVNGLFTVKEGDYYTLYTLNDKKRPEPVCEDLADAGYLAEGDLIPVVRQRERISVVDRRGDTRFTLEPCKGVEITQAHNAFHEGMLIVVDQQGRYGFANTSGEYTVTPRYDGAASFSEGYALVYQKRDGGDRYHIIDRNGDQVLTLKKGYEPVFYTVNHGRIAVKDEDDRVMFVTVPDGEETKCPSKVRHILSFDDRYYCYSTEDYECGVMTMNDNEQILRPRFTYITPYSRDSFIAGTDKGSAIYNTEGEEIHDLGDYKWIHNEGPFGLFALDGSTYIVLDEDGKERRGAEYDDYNSRFCCGGEMLTSDYFDVQAVVNSVVDMISSEGLARYRLGNRASEYLGGDAEDYSGRSNSDLDDLAVEGYKYSISVKTFFTENAAMWRFSNSIPGDFTGSYVWNPDALLNEFNVTVSTEYPRWGSEGNEALVAGLKAKGFTEIAATGKGSDRFLCLLRKGRLYAYVNGDTDSQECHVNFAIATPDEEDTIVRRINDINRGE